MRIPLDYYRILGIFPQVTDEQLNQAHHDRSLQLPRREYSEGAIASRKQLLDKAYEVLSDPETRAAYEELFLGEILPSESTLAEESSSQPTDESAESFVAVRTSTLDIPPEQLVGALIILQDLGEYELVLKLGESNLHKFSPTAVGQNSADFLPQTRTDIILSVALAALELSREKWQLEEYEQAAILGVKGLDLLQQNSLFPTLQTEIRNELNKLRPYRILELLAQPSANTDQRQQGKQLLKAMLQERQGIDGQGNDHSGLDIDDFLRFIQQLRGYLTCEEQQEIFMAEASRPSAVAAYLAVYALIARGFANRQPALIIEGQMILTGLAKRQNVALEQAICALLLGQTQTASEFLEQCQEAEALSFIREQSKGAPDLLPGLCWYGEQWIKTEVFSHFRDLSEHSVSLTEYFSDHEVQTFLEQLSIDSQEISLDHQQQRGVTMNTAFSRRNRSVKQQGSVTNRRVPSTRPHHTRTQLVAGGGGGAVATFATPVPVPMAPHSRRSRRPKTSKAVREQDNRLPVTTTYRQPQKPRSVPHSKVIPSEVTHPEKTTRRLPKRTKQSRRTFKPRSWLVWATVLGALG
ncbi:MAG TPA: molecular chaperone DnaJ, partial [Cyanothece sp. UBA12306]|nr:molecular chaperone DnaJ [Cyanothece sp. UBA12306]